MTCNNPGHEDVKYIMAEDEILHIPVLLWVFILSMYIILYRKNITENFVHLERTELENCM
jgi:hypothetical protein